MGSIKQADTLVRLNNTASIKRHDGPLTPQQAARIRARVLDADLSTVRQWFDEVNSELKFDRNLSPATPEQLGVLWRLEKKAGLPRTSPREGLSFEGARKRIEMVKRYTA